MKRLVLCAGLVICFFCMAVASPRLAQAQVKGLEPIKIGYSGIGIAHDFLKLMEKNRIFEKYGLSSQNIYIGSGSLMNQAILGGSIQFTTSDLPSQIQASHAEDSTPAACEKLIAPIAISRTQPKTPTHFVTLRTRRWRPDSAARCSAAALTRR